MKSDLSALKQKNIASPGNANSTLILEAVFNNIQDGVLLFDESGRLTQINPEGIRIHGLEPSSKDTLLNKPFPIYRISDDEDRPVADFRHPIYRVLAHESFSDESFKVQTTQSGPTTPITYSGFPLFDDNGNFVSALLIARSIPVEQNKPQLTKEVFNVNDQVEQLENYQKQLKEDRELFQIIIDTIPVMVTIYDKRIQSFMVNRAVENITGWTNQDISDTSLMKLAYPNPAYRKEVIEFMKSLKPGFKDIIMRTRDGRDVETSWANVSLPDGRQVGVGIDISARKRLEKDLITARKKAERESKVQYAFIQNISHEVRTPMNSILGFTELLQKELTRKRELEFLNAISSNGKQLLRLIDDIIDFSQLDNNQVSIQREELNLNEMMKQIEMQMEGMKKAYKKRQLKLQMKHPDSAVQVLLRTDRFRLQQVLQNLLGNAIKYTERGGVEIGYEIREDKKDILFSIKDTGIGIGVDDRNRVFKRFSRLHDTNSQEVRGTGLGLAICKHLVNLLGGEIWFDSNEGNGTVFYFTHPYHKLQTVKAYNASPCMPETQTIQEDVLPDLNDKVILIVEDDSFSYMMMYHMLEESKAIILHADTGRKAIEIFDKYKVDLVFLDIRLPEMDGYQVIRYMHQINRDIPVIAQTANALPEDRKRISDAGFDYHITKPISRDGLVNVLYNFL